MQKLIITACITGAEVTKEQQPNLPISPEEIAEAAYQAWKEGASIAHIHAREEDGTPSQNIEIYRQIKEKLAKKCDIIFQPSTGGAVWHTKEERIQPVYLKPEMASLSTGTCNFGADVFMNSQEYMEAFVKVMKENGTKPEIEIFEKGMIDNALGLVKKGLLTLPIHFDFVMGVPGAISGEARDLIYLVNSIPANCTWTVAGIGRYQLPLAVMAIVMGGHVRVGFEDNIYYSKGVLAESNAQLVARIARIAAECGREVANPKEARAILGLA